MNFSSPIAKNDDVPSCHLLFDRFQFTLIHGPNIPGFYAILFFTALDFIFITRDIHNWVSFPLWPSASFFLELLVFVLCSSPVAYWTLSDLGAHLPVSYLFAFSYCSWGSHSKNTGVICHSLLQWTTFCQNSSLQSIHLGWPCMAWLIASLSYASPFVTTRLWSMKGIYIFVHQRKS